MQRSPLLRRSRLLLGRRVSFLFLAFEASVGRSLAASPSPPEISASSEVSRTDDPAAAPAAPLGLSGEGLSDAVLEEVRAGLERELGRPVVISADNGAVGVHLVVVRRADATLELRLSAPGRDPIERTVAEPAIESERNELLILLGASIVKDAPSDLFEPAPPLPPEEPEPARQAEPPRQPEPQPSGEAKPVAAPVAPEPPPIPEMPLVPGHFSIVHPLATNAENPEVRAQFSMSLLQGRVGRLEGFGLAGYQSAHYGVEGVQVAYLANLSRHTVQGAQFALGANLAWNMVGLQLGALNLAYGKGLNSGAQLGFFNVALGPLEGLELALLANYSSSVRGMAVSFVGNVAGDVEGGMASLGVNVSRDLSGFQLGAINVARKVRGVQLGLINVADDVSGVSIGFISVTKSGGVHPSVWYSAASAANAGVRFSAKSTYSVLFGSWDVEGERAGPGYELGGSIPIVPERIFAEVSLGETLVLSTQTVELDTVRSLTELRGSLRFQVLPHLGFFVGGGYVGKVERATRASGNIEVGDWYYEGLANLTAGVIL